MRKMRFIKTVGVVIFFILGLVACSSSKRTAPEPAEKTWDLLEDDGQGVIFTAYEDDTEIPVQFKLLDNDNILRIILNDEPFPGTGSSTYTLKYIRSQLVIFGIDYKGETIDEIFCDCDKGADTSKQLHFEDDDDGNGVIDGDDGDIASTTDINEDGIFWTELEDLAEAPIVEDHRFVCTGGDRTFYVEVFKNDELCDDLFTLYFDFVNRTFRGKLVVTDVSYENQNDPDNSVVLWFE